MNAFGINTEFPRFASGAGSFVFVEIPQIFSDCVALCLFMAFHLLLLLFFSENVTGGDKFCFLGSPTPKFHIFILLQGVKFQECPSCWEPQGRASSAESRCPSLTLRHWISTSFGCLNQVLFQYWSLWVQQEIAEDPRAQPRPPHKATGLTLCQGLCHLSLGQTMGFIWFLAT